MLRRSPAQPPAAVAPRDWPEKADFETARILEAELKARIQGEVRFDRVSRMLYATDASNYQVDPVGVVIPKSQDDVIGAVGLAASHGVPILPRGGGSGLAGQTVGAALVIDTSKYLNRMVSLNAEARQATVEAGMVLDHLNRQTKPHGLMFGPDPSSSNRATIGGVVGNNAAGAHSILYGMTASNISAVRMQLPGGETVDLGPATMEEHIAKSRVNDATGRLMRRLLDYRAANLDLIKRDFPPHWRRATGYSLNGQRWCCCSSMTLLRRWKPPTPSWK
jgi:FAD/FMN-containing dehydrogenase